MSKNSDSDFGMYHVPIFSPRKGQFAILYLVYDPESSRDSLASRLSPTSPPHTQQHDVEGADSRNI